MWLGTCVRGVVRAALACIAIAACGLGHGLGKTNPIEIVPYASHGYAGLKEISFSGDGTKVVSFDDARVLKLWDVATGHLLRTIKRPDARYVEQDSRQLSVSKDGSRILWIEMASGEEESTKFDQFETLLDATTGAVIREYRDSDFKMLPVFAGNGGTLMAISVDGRLQTIDPLTGQVASSVAGFGQRRFVGSSGDGSRLLFQDSGLVEVWNAQTKRVEHTIPINEGSFASASFRDADRLIAILDKNSNIDLWSALDHKFLKPYNAPQLRPRHELKNAKSFVDGGGALLLFTEYDSVNEKNEKERFGNTLRLWNYRQSEFIGLEKSNTFIPHYDASTFLFSPDGKLAVGVGSTVEDVTSCLIDVWDTKTGSMINSITVRDEHMRECLLTIDLSPELVQDHRRQAKGPGRRFHPRQPSPAYLGYKNRRVAARSFDR